MFESKSCDLTVISNSETVSKHYQFQSSVFGNSRFSISKLFADFQQFYGTGPALVYDYIFFSATSLQEITTLCSNLTSVLQASLTLGVSPLIVVECTDFVNLEATVKKCLQVLNIEVLAIMSDFDVRILGENSFKIMDSKKESELVYIGKGSFQATKYTAAEVASINQLGNLLEKVGLEVYKLSTPLEFLGYQWKFALPQIVLGPLSIVFEQLYPESLYEYLLAKPLISGLILEIISVIRTMKCKLFQGYDNELSLIQRCIQLNPKQENKSGNFLESPKFFYNFYNQNNLYLDLLLLQPIFLADDFQIKTPYLEFLYAVSTKISETNVNGYENNSMFWVRKNDINLKAFKLRELEHAKELDQIVAQNSVQNLKTIDGIAATTPPLVPAAAAPGAPGAQPPQLTATPQMNENLDDLTDIAVYGAQLNGESLSPEQQSQQQDAAKMAQPFSNVPNNIYAQQTYQKQQLMNKNQYPPQQPNPGPVMLQRNSSSPTMQQQQQQQFGGYPPQIPPQQMYYQQGPPPPQQQQQMYYQQGPPHPQPRRMSSMPSYQSQTFPPPQPQGPPKPTSRKNRKSAFPGSIVGDGGVDFGGHGGMPGGNRPMPTQNGSRSKHQSSYNPLNGNSIVRPRPQHGGSSAMLYSNGDISGSLPLGQQQQQQQQQNRIPSQADMSTSTVLQNNGYMAPQQPLQQEQGDNVSSEEIQKQLQPALEIMPEQKANEVIQLGGSLELEPKPLGYTPGTNNEGEVENKDTGKKKKKKGLFSRKKK